MPTEMEQLQDLASEEYKYGFYTDVETDEVPPGLDENTIGLIASKKGEPEWMLQWRLRAYHRWRKMTEPEWPNVHYPPIDYQEDRKSVV